MSISPDQSRFTACVIGEAAPAEQSRFDAALLRSADLRAEAVAVSRTAHRLATALKQETTRSLTSLQRQAILEHGQMSPPLKVRKPARPAWFGPTLATAGIAAVLTLGLYAWPSLRPGSATTGPETGIPSVAIRPGTAPKTGLRPVVPPPALAKGTPTAGIPEGSRPATPARVETPPAMAATPPVITVVPAPPLPHRDPARDLTPPAKAKPGQNALDGTLASPSPRQPKP